MARSFVLGNGSILVDLDHYGRVRDFYFPFVGQENHVNGSIHRIGVWADETFFWFDHPSWRLSIAYEQDTLVTALKAEHDHLGLAVHFTDAVHFEKNIFLRKVRVINKVKRDREIRLFFHQIFQIFESNYGETAYYDPATKSIIHYKGKRYFLINGCFYNGETYGINSFATGKTHQYGLRGTWVDAEDGVLSGNPIEHGLVDSVVSFTVMVPGGEAKDICYWVCVGHNYDEVTKLNNLVNEKTPIVLLEETRIHWCAWANQTPFVFKNLSDEVINLFKRSLLVIRSHFDKTGSVIASSDSDILYFARDSYSYMWPRDGALITRSLDRGGYSELTDTFFSFCKSVLTKDGYLFHKYRPDGSLGSSWHAWVKDHHPQLPIQEDQTALVLDGLWKHFVQHNDREYINKIFAPFIQKVATFLLNFIDERIGLPKESYDIWEEKLGVHTWTCATIFAGFQAAAHFEKEFGSKEQERVYLHMAETIRTNMLKHLYDEEKGYFIKGLYWDNGTMKKDTTVDMSSTYGIYHFKLLSPHDKRVVSSVEYTKKHLLCNGSIGGYARYYDDNYHRISRQFPGNPWIITTLWLAEYYIARADNEDDFKPALDIFSWVVKHADVTGILAEQLNPFTGTALSVSPLTWSHAGFIIAINKYLERLDKLGICELCNPPKYKAQEPCEVCQLVGEETHDA